MIQYDTLDGAEQPMEIIIEENEVGLIRVSLIPEVDPIGVILSVDKLYVDGVDWQFNSPPKSFIEELWVERIVPEEFQGEGVTLYLTHTEPSDPIRVE